MIVGCGNVGLGFAARRIGAGHHVTGTTTTPGRVAEYADTLTATAATAAAAHPRVVFTSSISVNGRGRDSPVSEDTSITDDPDASPRNFIAAEATVLATARGAVVHLPDVCGHPRDIDYPSRVKLAHEMPGGSIPFDGDAVIYRIDYRGAAAALDFVVTHDLTGPWNAVPDTTVPPTNREFFAQLTAEAGYPDLTYRGEIATPAVPITSARHRAAGFTFHR